MIFLPQEKVDEENRPVEVTRTTVAMDLASRDQILQVKWRKLGPIAVTFERGWKRDLHLGNRKVTLWSIWHPGCTPMSWRHLWLNDKHETTTCLRQWWKMWDGVTSFGHTCHRIHRFASTSCNSRFTSVLLNLSISFNGFMLFPFLVF